MEAIGVELPHAGYLCWTSPLDRPKLGLQPGDVIAAILWFEKQTGRLPATVRLHPKCQSLASEVPVGIEVQYSGALAWECQLGLNRALESQGAGDNGQSR